MPLIRTTVARSAAEMDRLASLWEHLLRQQPHSSFQRFSWNRLAAELFHDRWTAYVVCVESNSGAAIIPGAIHRSAGQLELLGETLFDYRDVLAAGDPEALRLAWQRVGDCQLPFHVTAVDGGAAHDRWRGFPLTAFAGAPQLDRKAVGEEEFRRAHPRLGRQLRRLQRQGVTLRSYSGADSSLVRELYRAKRDQFAGGGNVFSDAQRCEFMIAVAALEASACEIFTLQTADESLVAGLVTFRDDRVRRFYTIYFNAQWADYSPGVALVYEVSARSLAEGLTCDYMTGEYPYKLRLANSCRPLYQVDVSANELAGIAKQPAILAA